MANDYKNGKNTKVLIVCGVLLLSAVNAAWMLSEEALDNHESFVSVAAREMLASGDWAWPTCNGEPRLQKTPLSYWLVAGLAKITGRVDEFAARMPSVIFAVLSVVAILYFVNLWLSFRIAVISGAVWATSLCYLRYSHSARPEMALMFFVLLCFLSFYSAVIAKDRNKQIVYMLVFWISFALGNLAKGPAPLPLVLIPLFFYVAIFRQWRKLFNWVSVAGVIIFLAIVLPWPLAIAHKVNWDLMVWKHEFVDRFFGTYAKGDYPPYFYFLIMFRYIAPWAAFLPLALAAPFYKVWNKKRPVMLFLWLWFVVNLVFLTINAGKRQHYILPSMPAMAILIGILLEDMVFSQKAYEHKFAVKMFQGHLAVVVVGIIIATICVAKISPVNLHKMLILASATIVAAAIIAALFAKGKNGWGCTAVFAGVLVVSMISYASFAASTDEFRYSRDFSKKVAQIVPPTENIVVYKHVSSNFVHYFGTTVPVVSDADELYNCYQRGYWIAAASGYMKELTQDNRFREVYRKENSGWREVSGALFHKSAPLIKKDSDT
ncbi:MAG: glycosyltransferase family 39 protein [Phycisphaerae bacterium]|nr:glycosyltransferase family 39 protein [Phycisphaerae bacterium]MDD5380179.1 glycosyltransferase family 39 protein [Phycisphaerae bacterium]